MIKFNNIQIGNFIMCEYDGKMKEGEVINLNGDEKQVEVETDVQAFWFDTQHLHGIPLSDEQMMKLNFTKEKLDNGSVKYKKGSFRMVIPAENNFSTIEIWYREDRRHNPDVHAVHELQNNYYQMTKVHLTKEMV
ncbi:MAG: hypothetical protein C0459_03015 [Chitinophaga sp.]|jgi:hypothetical protein|nr:hypothetical protein [Chitinophaga sp.]